MFHAGSRLTQPLLEPQLMDNPLEMAARRKSASAEMKNLYGMPMPRLQAIPYFRGVAEIVASGQRNRIGFSVIVRSFSPDRVRHGTLSGLGDLFESYPRHSGYR